VLPRYDYARHLGYTDGQRESIIRQQDSVLQCVAVSCSELQCVAVGCSGLQ